MVLEQDHIRSAEESELREIDIFFNMSKKLYADAVVQSSELYDIAATFTNDFKLITSEALLKDSRIIKILRYCIIPSLSQMKLGQIIGLGTVNQFESQKIVNNNMLDLLSKHVDRLAGLFNDNLDHQRFLWLNVELNQQQIDLARDYARKWTCSLISDQNSSTAFRNWRKDLQEAEVMKCIVEGGYTQINKQKIIISTTDLLPGQFSRECRVQGRTIQKADFAIRLKKSKKLLLIEAKAIGVRIDAFKRMKECREKADDWKSHFGDNIIAGAIIAGFIPANQVESLLNNNLKVFWEHHLEFLQKFIEEN